ncbi:MAG: JAB domain-containing protein [Fusobacteriaceae bacterium]
MEKNGHRERLREKYLNEGMKGFYHQYEQLEFLLSFLISRKDVKDLAKELLEKYKTIENVLKAPPKELAKFSGMGEKNPLALNFISDLHKEIYKKTFKSEKISMKRIEDVVAYLRNQIGHEDRENFLVMYLDSANSLIDSKELKSETLFQGTLDKSAVYPREVVGKILNQHQEWNEIIEKEKNKKLPNIEILENAVNKKAKSVIITHNHPSGNSNPSKSDMELTEKIRETLNLIDIRLIDHIIVTRESYFSFLEEGLLEI